MSKTTAIDNVIPRADIVKRAARLGAEIRNIKLSGDLPDETIGAINKVLLEHKVIFFRDQNHLDDSEQERFAVRLGKLVPHPTVGAIKGTSSILELDSGRGGGRADQWHTDVTFVDAYPKISVLRGVVIPPFGGDTSGRIRPRPISICRRPCSGSPTSSGPFTATPMTMR